MKKQGITVIGSNPIQTNPWMDPIHAQLCVRVDAHYKFMFAAGSCSSN